MPPFYLGIIYLIARSIQKKNIAKNPEYKYYIAGLFTKIIGGIGVVLIYCFYYVGGDTIGYFEGSTYLGRVFLKDPVCFLSIFSGNLSPENWTCFDMNTGYPMYYPDYQSFSVIRFTSLLTLAGGTSFIVTTILIACITYQGLWKLFRLFREEFPELEKAMAFAILFMPSVAFWGSAILKDSFTLCASAWLVYCSYQIFIKNSQIGRNLVYISISIYVLISLKPYIFFAVFLGIMIMLSHFWIKKIKNAFLRSFLIPMLFTLLWGGGILLMIRLGSTVGGAYESVDSMLEKAVITQDDLKTSERYGKNTFDIGKFDPTIPGILKKAPLAMEAGLFRPYLWECNNPVMLISGIENTVLVGLFAFVIILSSVAFFRLGPKYMFSAMYDNSLVVFSIIFSLSFAFFVGLTTANFGALVRYKIPLIPFLMAALFIIIRKYNREKEDEKERQKSVQSSFKKFHRGNF